MFFPLWAALGRYTVPEIFFNDQLIGGLEELEELNQSEQLDQVIQDCINDPRENPLPSYRRPESKEFLKVWANYLKNSSSSSVYMSVFHLEGGGGALGFPPPLKY